MSPAAVRLGRLGVLTELLLAGLLTAFLFAVTDVGVDAVPRPLALLALYATPAVIGGLGVAGRRRSLLLAAAIVLVPGSLLSMAGVTLVFVVPSGLFAAAAATSAPRSSASIVGVLEVVALIGLVLLAGLALFGITADTCAGSGGLTSTGVVSCGSGLLTRQGVAAELALLTAAVVLAAWRAGLLRALRRGGAS